MIRIPLDDGIRWDRNAIRSPSSPTVPNVIDGHVVKVRLCVELGDTKHRVAKHPNRAPLRVGMVAAPISEAPICVDRASGRRWRRQGHLEEGLGRRLDSKISMRWVGGGVEMGQSR
jgi:hypothetical protein